MAKPIPYKRGYSFTNYQQDVPDQPLPGNRVDIELDNIAQRSKELTDLVNGGLDISINSEDVALVAEEIEKVVYVADNMDEIRDANSFGPDIARAVDLFLGAYPNDPSTGHDGDPLVLGATYYNTLVGESRVFNGATWVPVAKVSTGGVLQGSIVVGAGETEFLIGDYVSLSVSLNGAVLEPGTDFIFDMPNIIIPDAQEGDTIVYFGLLKGSEVDAAVFRRQTFLTSAGVQRYETNSDGQPLNLTPDNHVMFGPEPGVPITYGVDYEVSDGGVDLNFSPSGNALFSVFSMPRFTNTEAQVLLDGLAEAVAGAGLTYADRAAAVSALPDLPLTVQKVSWKTPSGILSVMRQTGDTSISDMPGWVPAGVAMPEHYADIGVSAAQDTMAVQSAINNNSVVDLFARTYLITNITPKSGVTIRMNGATFLKAPFDQDNMFGSQSSPNVISDEVFDNFEITGGTIDGNKENQTHNGSNYRLGHLIVGSYTNSRFNGLRLQNSRRGAVRVSASKNVSFIGNVFRENGRLNIVEGVPVECSMVDIALGTDCEDIVISENYFDGQGREIYEIFSDVTSTVNIAVLVENRSRRVRITNNTFGAYGDEAIQFLRWDVNNPNVQDNTFRPRESIVSHNTFNCQECTIYAVNCGENADDISVRGNTVIEPKLHGFRISPWSRNIRVEGNTVMRPTFNGVSIAAGIPASADDRFGNLFVRDNIILNAGGHGIQAIGPNAAVIYDLHIDGNIVKNSGQNAAGQAAIRVAVNMSGGSISGNTGTDDQPTKTQAYGVILANPSGGSTITGIVKVWGNDLRGNLTASASVQASWWDKASFRDNWEDGDFAMYNRRIIYNLAAGASTAPSALPAIATGKIVSTRIVARDRDGADAFGSAVAIVSANAAGTQHMRVINLSGAAPAAGTAYFYW